MKNVYEPLTSSEKYGIIYKTERKIICMFIQKKEMTSRERYMAIYENREGELCDL